jgi:hypothetical protein
LRIVTINPGLINPVLVNPVLINPVLVNPVVINPELIASLACGNESLPQRLKP